MYIHFFYPKIFFYVLIGYNTIYAPLLCVGAKVVLKLKCFLLSCIPCIEVKKTFCHLLFHSPLQMLTCVESCIDLELCSSAVLLTSFFTE